MRTAKAVVGAACIAGAGFSQAALVTYNFTAERTSTEGDSIVRPGIVEALSTRTTITGSIIFDTTLRLARADEEIYEKPTLRIDGVDTTSANANVLTTAVKNRPGDDIINTSFDGSVRGIPEQYDIFIFTGIDQRNGLWDSDTAFPALLPAPGARTRYTLDFRSTIWDGNAFAPLKQAIYTLSSLTLDTPPTGTVPLPATSLLVLAGLGALGWVRRRTQG